MTKKISNFKEEKSPSRIQDRFIKNTIYSVIGILLIIFILIQPYNIFCRLKNTCHPIRLSSFSFSKSGTKEMTINFSGNISKDLEKIIEFRPDEISLTAINGKMISNFYMAKNLTHKNLVIAAHFEIDPPAARKYFDAIECICFQNQPLKNGDQVSMPMEFRIDPKIEQDPELKNLNEITLNYTARLVE